MITKSAEELRNELITELLSRLPNLDLTEGTPERDLFIEAPVAGQLMELWNKVIYAAKLSAPHAYSDDLLEEDLAAYMSNYAVTLRDATYAQGVVTFYTDSAPDVDIIIPDGTIVRTREAVPVEFEVQGTYTLYASIAPSYYNANTERYEINCAVQALNAGANSRAGANTVLEIATSISGVAGVTNAAPITGGNPAETVDEALPRVIQTFQGRGLGPTQGLVNYILSYVEAVNVVGANDPAMERDEGLGGAVDFYIIGETLTDGIDTVSVTSTGLENGTNVLYTSTGLILANQPVAEVVALFVNEVVIQTDYYDLSKDSGILSKSTQSSDKIEITSTGLANGFFFKANDTIEVHYIYNSLLATIESDLNATGNHYQNRDYLVREMTEVTIAVYARFKEVEGQDFDTVSDEVELKISEYINSVKNAGSLQLADIISIAKRVPTLDTIDLETATITPTGGGTITAGGDIIMFGKNEYPVAGAITLEQWTNA